MAFKERTKAALMICSIRRCPEAWKSET